MANKQTISDWEEAAAKAVRALQGFRSWLVVALWAAVPMPAGSLESQVHELDVAGLGEWAEWGAELDLDELAAAVGCAPLSSSATRADDVPAAVASPVLD